MELIYFPTEYCHVNSTCESEVQHLNVTFGKYGHGQVISYTFERLPVRHGVFKITVVPPKPDSAGFVSDGQISVLTDKGRLRHVGFTFEFLAPPASVQPAQGQVGRLTNANITVRGWGDKFNIINHENLNVTCCNQRAAVLSYDNSYTAFSSTTRVLVTMPACPTHGIQACTIGLGTAVDYRFAFEYYDPPTIVLLSPTSAFEDGRTSQSSAQKGTLRIQVTNVDSRLQNDKITVSVGQVKCNGISCAILSVTSPAADRRVIIITLPPGAQGQVDVVVDMDGRVTPMTPESKFTYSSLSPAIVSVLSCKQCNSGIASRCIVSGRCANAQVPYLSRTPFSTSSTVSIMIDSLNVEANTTSNITANLGSGQTYVTASRLVSVSSSWTLVEFDLSSPSSNRGSGTYTLQVRHGDQILLLEFLFSFFDDNIIVTCALGCSARTTSPAPVLVNVTNFGMTTASDLVVKFGNDDAVEFSVISTTTALTRLSIIPPDVTTACSYASS
jgi:hypothetical protein